MRSPVSILCGLILMKQASLEFLFESLEGRAKMRAGEI
jgi:hypothetical protein